MLNTEVKITQYLRPNGTKRIMFCDVGNEELAKFANENLILSAETKNGMVFLYARRNGESEENEMCEIADNGPGDNDPVVGLVRLIKRFRE